MSRVSSVTPSVKTIPMHLSDARNTLRKQLRTQRKTLSAAVQEKASEAIRVQLTRFLSQRTPLKIATYLANEGEVNLSHYITQCWREGVPSTFALPVLHPVCKGHLLFLHYQHNTEMVANRYGIKEPVLSCPHVIPTNSLDVILMPLVGFDKKGNRLGMGGGYYDRTLAFVRTATRKPKLIGIAHDFQEVASLPVASWDVPLDAIITPSRTLQF